MTTLMMFNDGQTWCLMSPNHDNDDDDDDNHIDIYMVIRCIWSYLVKSIEINEKQQQQQQRLLIVVCFELANNNSNWIKVPRFDDRGRY